MGTGRAHYIRMPQFSQRQHTLLAPAKRRETQFVPHIVFLSVRFLIILQAGRCEGEPDTVKYTDTETPKQKREIVSSRCATVTVQSFFGVVQSKQVKPIPPSCFAQQLTVLGCCLHTKSDMKSNSFCPRKSSGSS